MDLVTDHHYLHKKKGNLWQCQKFRTTNLISHTSKVILKITLNGLMPQTEEIIADEVPSDKYSVSVLCEKYLQHQQNLYHVFIDLKKTNFDSVWHKVLWEMNKYNLGKKIQQHSVYQNYLSPREVDFEKLLSWVTLLRNTNHSQQWKLHHHKPLLCRWQIWSSWQRKRIGQSGEELGWNILQI